MNKLKTTKKFVISIILTAVVAVGSTYFFLEIKRTQSEHKPFTYGTFDSYFTGQDSITYPLIFDRIRSNGDSIAPSVNFLAQNFEGFDININVAKVSRKDADNFRAMLIERGLTSEGSKITRNGYVGEIISYDLKAHPDPNTQSCSFSYNYIIPLAYSNNDLELMIYASQPDWGVDGDYTNCKIFDDQNYTYLKAMMDYVMANIQPAF